MISSVEPNVLSVMGGQIIVAMGTNLPSIASLMVGVKNVILSANSTHLVMRSPVMKP